MKIKRILTKIFLWLLAVSAILIATSFVVCFVWGGLLGTHQRIPLRETYVVQSQAAYPARHVELIDSPQALRAVAAHYGVKAAALPTIDYQRTVWLVADGPILSVSWRRDGVITDVVLEHPRVPNTLYFVVAKKFSTDILRPAYRESTP